MTPAGRAPRGWGQRFLVDRRACERIVAAFDPAPDDLVVEIGPGRGALTEHLAGRVAGLLAVEIDERLAAGLRERFAADPSVRILSADILRLLGPRAGAGGLASQAAAMGAGPDRRMRVIGNLPYSIATAIVRRLLGAGGLVSDATLMVQREVARRLLAGPGGREYGYISVLVALLCRARGVLELGPGSFRPPPKVRSAVVALEIPAEPPLSGADLEALETLLKAAFGQRRKKLINAVSGLAAGGAVARLEEEMSRLGIAPDARAERIAPGQFLALARRLGPAAGPLL